MAHQKSTVQIQGTIGNLTFFKSIDGYMVKAKSEVSKEKILSAPNFARTRENMAEFGNAGTSGKILRAPFVNLLQSASDPRMVSRLTARCIKVLKADANGKRGERKVAAGDLSLLGGFEFNNKGVFSTSLLAPYTIEFNRGTGDVKFILPALVPAQAINAPQGTTHYRLVLAAAPVDFSTGKNQALEAQSAELPWDNIQTKDLELDISLVAASALPVFILLQVQFLELLNKDYYPLLNGAYNACAVILVDI